MSPEPIVVAGKPTPPATSWWVGCDDDEFTRRAHREAERMTTEKLPAPLERALRTLDRERGFAGTPGRSEMED